MLSNNTQNDIAIIGGGIIGLAHAYLALQQGMSVVVIERDSSATGASVRNFGHACFTAQPVALRPIARRSRHGWLAAASDADLPVVEAGTLALARTPTELAVLSELAEAIPEDVKVVDRSGVLTHIDRCGPDVLGGAFMANDLLVDPRRTVELLAQWVDAHPNGLVRWHTNVTGFAPTSDGVDIATSRGSLYARHALVCVGHDLDRLAPDAAQRGGVERCRLSMMRVGTPGNTPIRPAIFTSTSLTRYGAFAEMPSAAALVAEVRANKPELVDIVANVMMTQQADGTCFVGDSHHYGLAAPPFMQDAHADLLMADLANALGVERFDVLERWQGVYASSSDHVILRSELSERVQAITVTSGVGMTLSFGIAADTLEQLHEASSSHA